MQVLRGGMRMFLAVVISLVACGTSTGFAAPNTEVAALLRVELATRQRILIQQIEKATCFAMGTQNPQANALSAIDAADAFSRNAALLRDGDRVRALAAERHAGVRAQLRETEDAWRTYGAATRQIAAGDRHAIPMAQILRLGDPMLALTDKAVMGIADAHRAALVVKKALVGTINIAGLQGMLIQKAAKEVCFIALDIEAASMRANLAQTVVLFEKYMDALEYGDYDLSVVDPPSLRFLGKIAALREDWAIYRGPLQRIAGGATPSAADIALVEGMNMALLDVAYALVGLYLE